MLQQHPCLPLYLSIFFIMFAGLLSLTLFEFFSFWSIPTPQFSKYQAYYTVSGKGFEFLTVLVGIQLYWGYFFLLELRNSNLIQLTSVWAAMQWPGTSAD